MDTPALRLIVSNHETLRSVRRCSTSPTRSLTISDQNIGNIVRDLQELMHLKPAYVGGIELLVRDQLMRQRKEHPKAAVDRSRMVSQGYDEKVPVLR